MYPVYILCISYIRISEANQISRRKELERAEGGSGGNYEVSASFLLPASSGPPSASRLLPLASSTPSPAKGPPIIHQSSSCLNSFRHLLFKIIKLVKNPPFYLRTPRENLTFWWISYSRPSRADIRIRVEVGEDRNRLTNQRSGIPEARRSNQSQSSVASLNIAKIKILFYKSIYSSISISSQRPSYHLITQPFKSSFSSRFLFKK